MTERVNKLALSVAVKTKLGNGKIGKEKYSH